MTIHLLSTHHYADGGAGVSPQNTSGVSGVNSVAAKSNEIEEISEPSSDVRKHQQKNPNMPPYCLCGVIQVSESPGNQIQLETRSFTPGFKPWYLPRRGIQGLSEGSLTRDGRSQAVKKLLLLSQYGQYTVSWTACRWIGIRIPASKRSTVEFMISHSSPSPFPTLSTTLELRSDNKLHTLQLKTWCNLLLSCISLSFYF